MHSEKKKCLGIVRDLQQRGPFPNVSCRDIGVFIRDFGIYRDRNASSIWLPMVMRYIVVNREFDFSNDQQLEALLAHELGHHERYAELGVVGYLQIMHNLMFRAQLSTVLRNEEERYADRKAIESGCARGLCELTEKNQAREDIESYMTVEEIMDYARSIGKW